MGTNIASDREYYNSFGVPSRPCNSLTVPIAILSLDFLFLDAYIYMKFAIHDEYWTSLATALPTTFTTLIDRFPMVRRKMLMRTLYIIKEYLHTFIDVPTSELEHLTFPSWSKLCYMATAFAKIVFFNPGRQNEDGRPSNSEYPIWDTDLAIKEAELP